MRDNRICAVILSGGSASRLWPLSQQHLPKQFLALEGAAAINDNEVTTVQKNRGTDIPKGAKHRLENRAAHR